MTWRLKGTYFETCNCAVVCPCNFLGAPTEGECTALVAWHVEEGADGRVALDNLNVAMAVHSPGPMTETEWRVALYLDERANAQQQESLTRIFGGQAGGHPAVLASFVGDIMGVASARIEYRADGRSRSVSIADVGAAEIAAIDGQEGNEVTVHSHPFSIAPGQVHTVARSRRLNYAGHGMSWKLADRHGFYATFEYQGA